MKIEHQSVIMDDSSGIRIAQISDIHIRPNTFHDEMEYTFERLFESIVENKIDLVVNTGDTFHNKITVSSEYFQVAYRFFKRLSDICPSIVTLGNHDMVLTNQSRSDAVSPILETLSNSKYKIRFTKYSESFDIQEVIPDCKLNIRFHNFSILDEKNKWIKKENLDQSKINICLYHGAINNCIVDNGWVSRGNRDDLEIFDGMHFGMLGDIHKSQFLTENKRIAYPGSLRQNNFGEDIDKGYLLWGIKDKDSFNVERVILPQKRYFFTLYLEGIKDLQSIGELPQDSRIRIKCLKSLDLAEEIKIKEEIISKYKPQGDVLVIPPEENVSLLSFTTKVGNLDIIHDNIRESEIQKQLIKEYLKKKDFSQEKIEDIIALDRLYHSSVDTDVLRNVIYHIKKLKFDNFFSYGKSNEINFDKLNGLIGIFGDTGSGKSSIIDSLFFLLHNGVYREGVSKNGEFINKKCKRADLKTEIVLNNETYVIERGIKKTFTKGKDEPKIENEVDFFKLPKSEQNSLNGESIPETNKNIKDLFGTKEELELTSLSPQFGLTTFIDARGTKKKETLGKFFDLGIFDTKYELALKDHKEIKSRLKDCNKDNLLKLCANLTEDIEKRTYETKELEEQISTHREIINDFDEDLLKYTRNIISIKSNTKYSKYHIQETISRLELSIESIQKGLDLSTQSIELANNKIKTLKPIVVSNDRNKTRLPVLKKQASLIDSIPNESICRTCSLASHAYEAMDKYNDLLLKIEEEEVLVKEFNENEEYLKIFDNIEKLKKDLDQNKKILQDLEEIEKINEVNKEWQQKIDEILKLKKNCQILLTEYNNKLMDAVSSLSESKTKLVDVKNKIKIEEELSRKDAVYSAYLDVMGKDGISYWIISKKLILINKLVNQILSYAVPFRFSIEDNEEEKSIKIFINDEKGKRPVELCSGGEKAIISIALRAALWKICLLPKTPILILDESLSFLDGGKRDSVIKLLKHLKNDYFKQIFLITHDEELKRVVDTSIVIDKNRGFSSVEIK